MDEVKENNESGWKFVLSWMGEHPFLTFIIVAMICSACNGGCK